MKFQSKFDVGDIIVNKLNSFNSLEDIVNNSDGIRVHRVQEIIVQRCYSATQIFYLTSPIHIVVSDRFSMKNRSVLVKSGGYNKDAAGVQGAWFKHREDEMEKADIKKMKADLQKVVDKINKS